MKSSFVEINTNPIIEIIPADFLSYRLDVDYYRPEYLELESQLQGLSIERKRMTEISKIINDGPGGWSLQSTEYVDHGIPLIRIVDFRSNLDPSGMIYISASKHEELKRYEVLPGDVLISAAGSIGEAQVLPESIGVANFRDLIRIRLKPGTDSYYLSAYLNSKYGRMITRRFAHGAVQLHLKVYDAKEISVVVPDPKIQAYIGDKVRLAEKCREEASQLLKQAKSDLNSALGFDLYSMASTANSLGRGYRLLHEKPGCILVENLLLGNSLLPTRYQSQYLERDRLLAEHVLEVKYLNEIAVDFINGYDCREFQTSGTPYLRVGNIHPNELDLDGVMYVQILPSQLSKKFRLSLGDLIITRKGSFGFCTSVTPIMEQMIFSSEIIRVPLNKGWDSDFIALFLNSPYGRYQFDRLGTGTTMKGINHENLADIKVPNVPYEVQKTIGAKIRLSMALNEKSKKLVAEACLDVEDLIDAHINIDGILTGEVQAPTWEEVYQIIVNDTNYA